MSDIPEWAIDRAKALHAEIIGHPWRPILHTFARYIAEHEEPPVDPLLIEAREIVAAWLDQNPTKIGTRWKPENFRAGIMDDYAGVQQALTALKRGMELANKEQKS